MAAPTAGTIVHLQELHGPCSPFRQHLKSLRVMGTLEEYDVGSGVALIAHQGAKLMVDTNLLRDVHFRKKSLYQFVGELMVPPQTAEMVLQARVARNVDGLDVNLYDKALQMRRQFEQRILSM